ncbi:MAG: xylanase, partial [Vallitaleaceae bacterium]|nr:xylanase [Vallitaleaceae bacterium]
KYYQNHHLFYSDSYRVAANIGLDALWFGKKEDLVNCNERLQKFFMETVKGYEDYVYEIDGTRIEEKVLHPVGLIATNAMASLATNGEYSDQCIRLFWETPLRTGERRYYDNFLYLFAFLALSGNYQIWE